VAGGAFAAFTFVPVAKYVKIVMANPAAKNSLVQIMIKPHRRSLVLNKFFAFQIHDPFLDLFLLGPYRKNGECAYNNENQNEIQILHRFLPYSFPSLS
jgi:hypothetical protein